MTTAEFIILFALEPPPSSSSLVDEMVPLPPETPTKLANKKSRIMSQNSVITKPNSAFHLELLSTFAMLRGVAAIAIIVGAIIAQPLVIILGAVGFGLFSHMHDSEKQAVSIAATHSID